MKVSAINSTKVAFKQRNEQKGPNRYFEYLSKNSANDALMMSKDREAKDGKFKFAQFATGLGAVASVVGGSKMCSNLAIQYFQHYDPKTGVASFAEEAGKKFIRNTKIMSGLFAGALALGAACIAIGGLNRISAESSAKERGFLTLKDRMKMKNTEEVYQATEETYDKHVKQ